MQQAIHYIIPKKSCFVKHFYDIIKVREYQKPFDDSCSQTPKQVVKVKKGAINTMSKTLNEKIEEKERQIEQLENQKKQLMQQQKAAERKERTSRLCKRHGLLEKYMPDIINITDEQFEMFLKRAVANSYGRDILAQITMKTNASTTETHLL